MSSVKELCSRGKEPNQGSNVAGTESPEKKGDEVWTEELSQSAKLSGSSVDEEDMGQRIPG